MVYLHETGCEDGYYSQLLLESELQIHYGNQWEYENVGVEDKAAGSNRHSHVETLGVP